MKDKQELKIKYDIKIPQFQYFQVWRLLDDNSVTLNLANHLTNFEKSIIIPLRDRKPTSWDLMQ